MQRNYFNCVFPEQPAQIPPTLSVLSNCLWIDAFVILGSLIQDQLMLMSRSASLPIKLFWYSYESRHSNIKTTALNGLTKKVRRQHISITLHIVKRKLLQGSQRHSPESLVIKKNKKQSLPTYASIGLLRVYLKTSDSGMYTRKNKTGARHTLGSHGIFPIL